MRAVLRDVSYSTVGIGCIYGVLFVVAYCVKLSV